VFFVLHTQYYPPEMGAPQARLSDLAHRLRVLGHEVQVLTAMPNYPHGHTFAGYPRGYKKERLDGILVHRAMIVPSNRSSLLPRLISYLSFCLSSFLVGVLIIEPPDIIITESPPLFLAITGWLLAKIKCARFIMNVSDLWPDSAKHIGMLTEGSLSYGIMRRMAHFAYRQSWLVTGQSREIIEAIASQVPEAKTYHLSNGVDPENFSPQLSNKEIRKRYLQEGELGFVYAGLHGLFQGLDQILSLAEQMRGQKVRFLFFGDGPEKDGLIKTSVERRLENVDFYPALPHREMPAILASTDVAVIPLKSKIVGAVPSKIYEAMASGIPILLVAGGEARDIVEKSNSGLVASPGDFPSLSQAANRLAADSGLRKTMGQAGREAAVNTYNRMEIVQKYAAELQCRFGSAQDLKATSLKPIAPRGYTIQRVEGKLAYASQGYTILRSSNRGGNWEEDGIVAVSGWKKFAAPFPLLSRILRARVFGVCPLSSGARISLVADMIVRARPQSTVYECVFRFPPGSRALNLCVTPDRKIFCGEYLLNLRRSASVHVYCSQDDGIHWDLSYTFPKESICHIHRVAYDPYDDSILVCTGDRDQEVAIYQTTDEFRTLKPLVGGGQEFRTTSLIPRPDYFVYGTDNPGGRNFIMALDRRTRRVERLQELPGPVLYGGCAGEQVAFATMIEKGHHEITVWAGQGKAFRQVAYFAGAKSNWLWREMAGYRTVILPEGAGLPGSLFCTPVGTVAYDGIPVKIEL
jgi:glycosyltransferase involved in cell wall biosynthesis